MANGQPIEQFVAALQGSVAQVNQTFLSSIPAVQQATQVVGGFADSVSSAHQTASQITAPLQFLAENHRQITDTVRNAAVQVGAHMNAQGLAAGTTRVWTTAQTALNNAFRANPIGFIITVLQYLITAIITAYQNSETFRNIVHAAFEAIQAVATRVFDAIKSAVDVVWPAIQAIIEFVVNAIKVYITTYFTIIRAVVTTVFNAIRTVASAVWGAIQAVIEFVVNAIRIYVTTYFTIVRTVVTTIFNAIRAVATAVWNGIKTVITGAVNTVVAIIGRIQQVYTVISGAFNRARIAVTNAIGSVVSTVRSLPGRATSALGNLGNTLLSKGKALIQGFINGIKSMASSIVDTIKSFVIDKIPGPIKSALGIKSPSRLMEDIGRQIGAGLAVGIERSGRQVAMAMSGLVPVSTPGIARTSTARSAGHSLLRGLTDTGLAGAVAGGVTVNVYAQPGQSEYEIGRIAARELAWAGKR